MAEAESDEAVRLRSKVSEMLQSPSSFALPASKEPKSSSFFTKSLVEAESDEAVRLRSKASEMLQSPSSIALPASKEPKSSSFLTKSLAEMVNEDPIRLQNQSCVIREEITETVAGERRVYSSLARLPTFSIGHSSTQGEAPPRAPPCESRVDQKEKNSPRYFQMPELGARIFVGDVNGCDTITCHLIHYPYGISEVGLDFEKAVVRSVYEDDRPGGLNSRLRGLRGLHAKEFWRIENYVILSGTKLVVPSHSLWGEIVVGNLREMGSSIFGIKDCIGDETIRQPSDIIKQPRDTVPSVSYYDGGMSHWRGVEGPHLLRYFEGSYLEKPKFMKEKYGRFKYIPSKGAASSTLQLTRFDDFVIVGSRRLRMLSSLMIIDIVRKNASETADVIAAQLIKSVVAEEEEKKMMFHHPITIIVIFLNHKEILLRECEKEKKENVVQKYKATFLEFLGLKGISQSTVLKDDKNIIDLKEEEKITTFKGKEHIFLPEMEDKEGIKREEDYNGKKLVGESLPNVSQISTISLQEKEVGMKPTTICSNLPSAIVQVDLEASSSIVLIEDDDCKSEDLKVSCHITKWIICRNLLKTTLLCFFNVTKVQFEFYFEDHESMATIIGLGVPHSKVILECGSPHVAVVEISKEDWNVAWANANVIPHSILEGNILKPEMFPDILHRIVNIINIDSSISKANNGGREENGKGKAQGNVDNKKGKAKGPDDHGNASHPNGSPEGAPIDNDNNMRKEKDGNNDKKDIHDQDNAKTSEDCKEVQVVVHLLFLPGGVLEEKKKELVEVHEDEEEAKGKKKEWRGCKEVEKKKKYKGFCFPLKRGENDNAAVGNQQKLVATTKGIENGDVDESLHGNQPKSTAIERVENGDVEGEVEEKKEDLGEIHEEEGEEKEKELGGQKGVGKKKKWVENGNLLGNQQKSTTSEGVENGDVDESLKKQLEKQIHSQMVFTFTIKNEAGGQLKTIKAAIDPITFQLPSNNKENYLQWRCFGWFHDYLQVAFGVGKEEVATLEPNSCKVLDSYKAKEVTLQGNSQENARTIAIEMKAEGGLQYIGRLLYKHGRTYGSGARTTKEHKKSLDTEIEVTKQGGFIVSEHTDHNTCQLKYFYCPYSPFKEEELMHEDDCLKMYKNPICQIQRVSCEGTWKPDCSENLEAYKLEASRKLQMTRICNLDPKIREEKKQKLVWKGKPFCFIQKLEKVVYLNHAMSHLTSSTSGVYRLQERQNPSNSSTTIFTQAQRNEEPKWPGNDPLVDVRP